MILHFIPTQPDMRLTLPMAQQSWRMSGLFENVCKFCLKHVKMYLCICVLTYCINNIYCYYPQGLSTVSGFSSAEQRPTTIGQSQSVINIHRMSPTAETKKRRAPAPPGAPTPSMRPVSFERNQVSG